jgi:hypothetical protein
LPTTHFHSRDGSGDCHGSGCGDRQRKWDFVEEEIWLRGLVWYRGSTPQGKPKLLGISKVPGYPDLKGQFKFADDQRRSPNEADFNNFQPRIGFAYELNDKTAIRAGYGIFYTVSHATIKGHTGSGFSTDSTPEWSRDGGLTAMQRRKIRIPTV